ncbi:serendipity locus protein delta-like [Mastacembelus armatus]|uniref:Zinc finger protein 429-like n=1 Tax=Mastacembelus armatus TaxID=205130 RepID=A0A3Q3MAM1_9TELE|nr:serendipity locus protein delta-like [Mastacembelus armatus]
MCSVLECGSWSRGVQRFKVPEDPEKRLEWVQFLFEVNGQRLKESSWTDITICSEHFAEDCFEHLTPAGTVQVKPDAVPSLCPKSEPEEPLEIPKHEEEPVETTERALCCDEIKMCDSLTNFSEDSGLTSIAVPESPVPSDTPDVFTLDYEQMLQKIVNIDMIREKAALLQMKGKYVVNEKHLIKLFSSKCPSCGSKVKMEKVIHGTVLVLNQQCLQCEYRNQWKSQMDANVPSAEDAELTGATEVPLEVESTDDNHSSGTGSDIALNDEESDFMDVTEGSGDEVHMESDDDWNPKELQDEFEEESEDDDDLRYGPRVSQLCTECGVFINKSRSHTCEHKMKPYSCTICGKRCANELALTNHSRIHDENYEFCCKYCYVTFKTKVDKITHEQIHLTEGKPHECPDCSETFATNKQRRNHLKGHRGPKKFKCHTCGMEFYSSLPLERHLVVHTGEKPFNCSVCQRGFNQAGHLKSHMRLHTGERPFNCQHCDKCFTHNVSLKSHIQRYHTSSSGLKRKEEKTNEGASDTGDSQDGNESGADSELDNVEEEQDKEKKVEKKRIRRVKQYRKSTGRPIGRPKRNATGNLVLASEIQGQGSNSTSTKSTACKLKRTHCSDEESEAEPKKTNISIDITEENWERSEKMTLRTSRSRRKPKTWGSDSDFES